MRELQAKSAGFQRFALQKNCGADVIMAALAGTTAVIASVGYVASRAAFSRKPDSEFDFIGE